MDLYETNTHSFIFKVWLEGTTKEASQAAWRGHITHMANGERRHLKKLDDIVVFIAPYLEKMGGSSECVSGRDDSYADAKQV